MAEASTAQVVTVAKAQPVHEDDVVPGVTLAITGEIPQWSRDGYLHEAKMFHRQDAEKILAALKALPGGTTDALFALMAQDRASILRVPGWWATNPAPVTGLRMYCWECKGVHVLELGDVERIVYALSLQVTENAAYIITPDPPCPLAVLADACAGQYFQAVELAIGRREEAAEWGAEQRNRLDGLEQLVQQRDTAAAAAVAIHRPCHTPETEPWGCEWGHGQDDTGLPGPDEPAKCTCCTYDDRTVTWPCPTAQALGSTG